MDKFGWIRLGVEAYKEYVRDRSNGLATSLAYYQLLCVGPLVGFSIFFYSKIFGAESLQKDLLPVLKSSFTPQLTKVIIFMLSTDKGINVQEITSLSFLSALLLLWASQQYFGQVKDVVETSWNQRREPFGFKDKIGRIILGLKITLVAVFLMLLFISIRSLLPHPLIMEDGGAYGKYHLLFKLGQMITTFAMVFFLRIFYFTYIPPVKVYWRNTIPGALIGAFLFIIGREIMATHFDNRPDADAAESIVMVLLWFYYSGLTFVYSAEFTKLYVASKQNIDLKNLKFDE